MELRAFVQIFIVYKKILWSIIVIALSIGCIYYILQPERYSISVTLNIARTGIIQGDEQSEDYASFYRLQADERFADTVVRWLQSPRIVEDILIAANVDTSRMQSEALRKVFDARRFSSQVVDVRFFSTNKDSGQKQVTAMTNSLNTITQELNKDNHSQSWFHIVAQEPVIHFYEKSLLSILLASFFIGSLIAFVVIVLTHYYREDSENIEKNHENRD